MRYHFPPYEQETLSNGLSVMWTPHSEHDGLLVALQLPTGKYDDPAGKEGTAELWAALVQKASETHDTDIFTEKIEQHGALLFSSVQNEYLLLGCKMMPEHAHEIVPLFWDMVVNPGFPAQELAQLKKEMVAHLQSQLSTPSAIASRQFYRDLYSSTHAAGRYKTLTSIKNISLSDIRSFHKNVVRANGAHCIVIGNMSTDEMKSLNEVPMSCIPDAAPAKESESFPKAVAIRKTRVHIVNKPSVSQTSFMVGKSISAGEGSPQRHALLLANYAFGGGNFSSRLLNALRSDQGKTYSIGSHLDLNTSFGTFIASATTQHHQLTQMLHVFFSEHTRLVEKGITQQELTNAKKYAIGSMAFQLEGIGNIAEKLLWLRLHNRPDSYIETYADRINDFSLDYVNKAIAEHFGAGAFIVATCGEKAQIYEGLKEFGQVHTSSLNSSIK